MKQSLKKQRGFTLIELMVMIDSELLYALKKIYYLTH